MGFAFFLVEIGSRIKRIMKPDLILNNSDLLSIIYDRVTHYKIRIEPQSLRILRGKQRL